MSAELESMFYAGRQKPWHGLGTQVSEALTSADAIRMAGLDWVVEPKRMYLADGTEIKDFVANTRNVDNAVFGVVTEKYKIVQNKDAFDFTDSLVGGDVRYETAGSLFGGRKIWLLARMPNKKVLDEDFENYVCFTNSHDGRGAIRVCCTNVRVVCNNTLNIALNTAKRSWSTKHMGNMEEKLAEAQHTLQLSNQYLDEFAVEADRLAHTRMSDDEVQKVLNEMFPTTADMSERQLNTNKKAKDNFMVCYYMPDIEKYHGTKYGIINAMADFADHVAPARMTKTYAEANFDRVVNGHILLDKCYSLVNAN